MKTKFIFLCITAALLVVEAAGDATGGGRVAILLGTARGVFKVTEGSEDEEPAALTRRRCYALDYHYANGTVYVATDDKIISLPIDSESEGLSPSPTTVARSETRITSLAVDWLADVLYYVSDQRGAIRSYNTATGSDATVLEAGDQVASPNWNSIAVDPYSRKLFWLGSGGFYSYGLGGEDLSVTALAAGLTPFRLSLDTQSQVVYVLAGATKGIKLLSCEYDCTGMKEVLKIPHIASTVYGFGVIENVIYWESNFDGENLFKMEIPEEGSLPNITTLYEINNVVSDVKIYHPYLQKPKENTDTKFTTTQKKLRPNDRIQLPV